MCATQCAVAILALVSDSAWSSANQSPREIDSAQEASDIRGRRQNAQCPSGAQKVSALLMLTRMRDRGTAIDGPARLTGRLSWELI